MDRGKQYKISKMNNKGLSLIEILVAMLILSTISIVFLQSFAHSAKMNNGAKAHQEVLTFEQSLMEGLKAYDTETLDIQFDEALTTDTDFKLLSITSADRSCVKNGTSRTYYINNVPFESANYSATITMTPKASYTDKKLDVEAVNAYNDGFFFQDRDEQDVVTDAISQKFSSESKVESEYGGSASVSGRVINVNIEANDKVTVTSTYNINGSYMKNAGGVVDFYTISNLEAKKDDYPVVYNNEKTQVNGAVLEKLYIYYYPAYTKGLNNLYDVASDKIVINSSAANLKEIYILKQVNEEYVSVGGGTYNLQQAENDYEVDVECSSVSAVEIYHNLADSLSGTGITDVNISGSGYVDKGNPWSESTEDSILMYDATVQIFNADTGAKVGEIIGSTNLR